MWNRTLHILSYGLLTLGITIVGMSYHLFRLRDDDPDPLQRIHDWVRSSRRRANPLLALVDINYAIGYWNALCDTSPHLCLDEIELELYARQTEATLRAFGHFVQPSDLRTLHTMSQNESH